MSDVGNKILHFGKGRLVVDTGTYASTPSVFVAAATRAGVVGQSAAIEGHPRDTLQPGEVVLTFPTDQQALRVADALVSAMDQEEDAGENDRLRAVIADLVDVLIQAEDYLDKRADSEDSEFGPVPNAEMSLLTEVQQALEKAEGKS